MYELYISKLNKQSTRLWQKPKQGEIFYIDEEWYEKRHVGHDPLERFMKFLAKDANLSTNIYSNHSIRATCICTLDNNGFEARHITAISGHKNESTIKTYATKCPDEKKKEMYQALNTTIVQKKQVDKPEKEFSTINMNDIHENPQENSNNNNNNNSDLPENFELIPFENDEETDNFLLDYIRSNPEEQIVKTTTNTTNTVTTNSIPVVPRMYFPHSNVTINYNFTKQ